MMNHLVIGTGQVGSAIFEVLSKAQAGLIASIDVDTPEPRAAFDVLHVCYYLQGDLPRWVNQVLAYREKYGMGDHVVCVHATVPVGATRKLGSRAVHSPVRGIHPRLTQGIFAFVKYFGGEPHDVERASEDFKQAGVQCEAVATPEDTEFAKLWSTNYYHACIAYEKAHNAAAAAHRVNAGFTYTKWNQTYNEGYEALDHPEYMRPILQHVPGPIGGHCVIPNTKLSRDETIPAEAREFLAGLLDLNEMWD